jgi:hypothetical protein
MRYPTSNDAEPFQRTGCRGQDRCPRYPRWHPGCCEYTTDPIALPQVRRVQQGFSIVLQGTNQRVRSGRWPQCHGRRLTAPRPPRAGAPIVNRPVPPELVGSGHGHPRTVPGPARNWLAATVRRPPAGGVRLAWHGGRAVSGGWTIRPTLLLRHRPVSRLNEHRA